MSGSPTKGGIPWKEISTALLAGIMAIMYFFGDRIFPPRHLTPDQMNKIMEGAPDTLTSRENLTQGRAALGRQDLDRAITYFTEVIRRDPKCAEAYYFRGIAYGKKGDQVRAMADREEAIRLNPALGKEAPH